MPDNTPRENNFLKQNQATQFVKKSTDEMSRKIGSIFNNTAKSFNETAKIQVDNNVILKRIDSSLISLNKTILEQQNSITKSNTETLRLQKQTALFLKETKTTKETKTVTAKDIVRRQDPNESMRKNIADVEDLLKDIRDNDEEERRKKSKGILGLLTGIGGMFAGGGLLGYLMTGKKEFLFSVVKGFTKYISKGLAGLFKTGKILKNVKGFMNVGKVFNTIGKAFKSVSNIFGKGVVKSVGKVGGKSFLKKIPVVGGLLGLFFGIQRFKKGDFKGGLLEIASGVASIVPGIGTALSVGIDALLMFRDLKGTDILDGGIGQNIVGGIKKISPVILRNLPGIGTIIRVKEAFTEWVNGNKLKSLSMLGGAIATIIPGGGLLFDAIPKIIKMVTSSNVLTGAKNILSSTVNIGKDVISSTIDVGKDALSSKAMVGAKKMLGDTVDIGKDVLGTVKGLFDRGDGGYDVGSKVETISQWGRRAFGKSKSFFGMGEEPKNKDKGFNPIKYVKTGVSKLIDTAKRIGVRLYSPWNPDFEGLDPSMKLNFSNMAKDYYNITGDDVQVNSGKRKGGGNSVHDYGFAIDINSNDANKLESMGLLKKYGFHRPLLNWEKMKEPWHVEPYPGENVYGPRDTINNEFRIGTLMNRKAGTVKPKQGDGGFNLPQGIVDVKYEPNKPLHVMLSSEDIDRLANAFGEQMKKNKPKAAPLSNTQIVSGRQF